MHQTDSDRSPAHKHHVNEWGGHQGCAHNEIAKIETYLPLYLAGGVLVLVTLFSKGFGGLFPGFGFLPPDIADVPALIGALILGTPLVLAAIKELRSLTPSSSTLVALAIVAALVTGEYATAGLLAFVLLLADQILSRTAFGAQRAIEDLINLTPDIARIVKEDGAEEEVDLDKVKVGMTVRVRPGENLPVDGIVASGRSTINQASLTGEAMPVEVQQGSEVYAGTSNLTGQFDMTVNRVGEDTTIGKVTELIREAETSRTPRQLLIQRVSEFFVPIALMIAGLVWFISSQSESAAVRDQAAQRAITVLIVACPAALLLASPSAMLAAFAAAARLGIMVKRVSTMETAGSCDAYVFDKTGTMTTGKFEVSRLVPAEGIEGAELLRAAAEAEVHSNHPLAQSIVNTARAARIEPEGTEDFEEIHGRGVRARTGQGELHVGRAKWLVELFPDIETQIADIERKIEGMSGVHVVRDGKYLGVVGLEDKVRRATRGVVGRLRELGARTVAIFTGDRLSVAKRVGVAVGVDAIEAECLPEEKHEQIHRLTDMGYTVMMVGDGINDGPSLAAADVGVAMGLAGSDIAANSADVALMTDDLSRIPFLVELSRRTKLIIAQNIAASILIVIVGLVLASTGMLAVPAAALYHFAGEIFVLANSFRLVRFSENFHSYEEPTQSGPKRREASIRNLGAAAQPA